MTRTFSRAAASELSTFANSILQGKFERASRALVRFAVNSTVGVAGFFAIWLSMPAVFVPTIRVFFVPPETAQW